MPFIALSGNYYAAEKGKKDHSFEIRMRILMRMKMEWEKIAKKDDDDDDAEMKRSFTRKMVRSGLAQYLHKQLAQSIETR